MPASEDSAVEMALLKKMKQEVEAQVSMLQNLSSSSSLAKLGFVTVNYFQRNLLFVHMVKSKNTQWWNSKVPPGRLYPKLLVIE